MTTHRLRIALYSHDTQGLGHVRRNLAIATALMALQPRPVILLIAGAREAGVFPVPPGIDTVTLPAFSKDLNGHYYPRSLSVSLAGLVALRANIIRAALQAFQPHVLIVDKVPLGTFGELEPSLKALRTRGTIRFVLGLRDVLDDPATVRREWHLMGAEHVVRVYYNAVWVYGDPVVYNPVREYRFSPAVAARVRYTGFLARHIGAPEATGPEQEILTPLGLPPGRLALCLVGGGQDGYQLASTFARASRPADMNGVIVTGPFMPFEARRELHRLAAAQSRLRVLGFVPEPEPLLRRADCVVAMGGYNTVCEVLSLDKRALIVPRVKPRREQLIRARRLQALGLLDVLHPDDLTPGVLAAWLAQQDAPRAGAPYRPDMDGLARLPHLLSEMLAWPRGSEAFLPSRPDPWASQREATGTRLPTHVASVTPLEV